MLEAGQMDLQLQEKTTQVIGNGRDSTLPTVNLLSPELQSCASNETFIVIDLGHWMYVP